MSPIRGKTLIVTGASRGIGRALALALANAGVHLVLNARSQAPLEEVVQACRRSGVQAQAVAGSIAEAETAEALVAAALEVGGFYGYIHNAGVLYPGPFVWELPEPQFRAVIETHLVGGYQLARFAVPKLLEAGGGLAVYVGSGAAETNLPGIGAYAVAKAAEEHLAKQIAAEAPQITCFVYRPGVVETRMQQEAREAQGSAAEALHRIFRGYREQRALLTPEETAALLVRILQQGPERFHGRIATWQDGT